MATQLTKGQHLAIQAALDSVKKRSDANIVGAARVFEAIDNKLKPKGLKTEKSVPKPK